MASTEKRQNAKGETRYRGIYYIDGRKKRTPWMSKQREAKAEALRLEDAGKRSAYVDPNAGNITLDQTFPNYQQRRIGRKPSSVASEERRYRTLIQPTFGEVPLKRISNDDVVQWFAEMKSVTGKTPSDSGKTGARRLLTAILDSAVDAGRIPRNPARTLSGKANIPVARRQSEHRFLQPRQLLRLATTMNTEQSRAIVLLGGLTGLRWGEISALRVGDLDLSSGVPVVRVARAYMTINGRPPELSDTKTHEARMVALPALVATALVPFCVGKSDDALVFQSKSGEPLRHKSFSDHSFHKAQERAQSSVARLQELLALLMGNELREVPSHGKFDASTEETVRSFQRRAGLVVDGNVRRETWSALFDGEKASDGYRQLPQGEKVKSTARNRALLNVELRLGDEDWERIRLHDLRHTAASIAISAGGNIKHVQRMLGHGDASVTLNTYAALFDQDQYATAGAMNAVLDAAAGQVKSPSNPHGHLRVA